MVMHIIKGFFIGIAAVVPGLSASIFAIIVGLYEQLLFAVSDLRNNFLTHLKFLVPVGIGAGVGVLVSVGLMLAITELFPAYSYLFFVGLVIGSIPMIYKKIPKSTTKLFSSHGKIYHILWVIFGFTVVLLMANATGSDGDHIAMYYISSVWDFVLIMIVGAIAISLMILPGVSGSLILIILGHFGTIYNAASQFGRFLISLVSSDYNNAFDAFYTLLILVPFAIGAVIGLFSISKLMNWLLEKYETAVYYAVIGTLFATIWILFDMGVLGYMPFRYDFGGSVVFAIIGLLCIVAGYVCTRLLDNKG